MVEELSERPRVIVVADDAELGGLIALNLRRRGLLVEQTDFALAVSPYWEPATGRPGVVVIDAERPGTDVVGYLHQIQTKVWMNGVPVVLGTDRSSYVIDKIGDRELVSCTRPEDVGRIVAATLGWIRSRRVDRPKLSLVRDGHADQR